MRRWREHSPVFWLCYMQQYLSQKNIMWLVPPGVAQRACSGGSGLVKEVDQHILQAMWLVLTQKYVHAVTGPQRKQSTYWRSQEKIWKKLTSMYDSMGVKTWGSYQDRSIWDGIKPETMAASRVGRVPKQTNQLKAKCCRRAQNKILLAFKFENNKTHIQKNLNHHMVET